jgi:hypothetical protein
MGCSASFSCSGGRYHCDGLGDFEPVRAPRRGRHLSRDRNRRSSVCEVGELLAQHAVEPPDECAFHVGVAERFHKVREPGSFILRFCLAVVESDHRPPTGPSHERLARLLSCLSKEESHHERVRPNNPTRGISRSLRAERDVRAVGCGKFIRRSAASPAGVFPRLVDLGDPGQAGPLATGGTTAVAGTAIAVEQIKWMDRRGRADVRGDRSFRRSRHSPLGDGREPARRRLRWRSRIREWRRWRSRLRRRAWLRRRRRWRRGRWGI